MATLISDIALPGRSLSTYQDIFVAESAVTRVVQAAGGEVRLDADFREQTIPVTTRTTLPGKVAAEGTIASVAPVASGAKFDVEKWAEFTPITIEDEQTRDPADLIDSVLRGVVTSYPKAFDSDVITDLLAGANITAATYTPATGVASLKAVLDNYVSSNAQATGMVLTRYGAVELGFTTDGDARRMDLTNALGIPFEITGIATPTYDPGGGAKNVLGIIGPWDASNVVSAMGLTVDRMPQATVDSKGPATGHINYRTMAAMGHGNAYGTNASKVVTADDFVVLHAA